MTSDAWRFAMRVLDTRPDTAAATRKRFVLSFAYSTGLRRAELCGAFTDDVQERFAGPQLGTIRLLRVVGRRAKERFVPLVAAVLDLMGDYLEARGLPRDPLACPAAAPLIQALLSSAEIGQIQCAAKAAKPIWRLSLLRARGKPGRSIRFNFKRWLGSFLRWRLPPRCARIHRTRAPSAQPARTGCATRSCRMRWPMA